MKETPIDAELGQVEAKFGTLIDSCSAEIIGKRQITNEATWKRSTRGDARDFSDQVRKLLDQLADLYEEIQKWPSETEDE